MPNQPPQRNAPRRGRDFARAESVPRFVFMRKKTGVRLRGVAEL